MSLSSDSATARALPRLATLSLRTSDWWKVRSAFLVEGQRDPRRAEWYHLISKRLAELFPSGVVLGVVDLTACIAMSTTMMGGVSPLEYACGAFEPGRFAWKLENWRAVVPPRAAKGKLGLWDIEGLEVNGDKAI